MMRYFRGKSHFEVDLHVGSSLIAEKVVSLCRTYSSSFVCNIGKLTAYRKAFALYLPMLGVVIQGESNEELPEQLLCCVALHYPDINNRVML